MKTIRQTYFIEAPVSDVWQALINPKKIDAWGGGPAKMDDKPGTEFTLWGGSIWGKNIKVEPEKELVQEWFSDEDEKWDKPSIASFMLVPDKNGTRLDLLHTDVPGKNAKSIDEGWKEYYLGPLKEFAENQNI